MSHSKLNAIMAAAIFVISLFVYGSTVAPTTSFWDCGEFIACSYILGVPHPPGAPLFILLGRLFTMIPEALIKDVGLRVNIMSPLLSALTAMLSYLIIVRLVLIWKETPRTWMDKLGVYGAGVIGALAFAFSDSQWFNSVEAEVYAGSMFFTAIVIWLILKWMDYADSSQADRYILIIFYLMGLAIGVHLLNLLALPAIAMIIFARRYQAKKEDVFQEFFLMLVASGLGLASVGLINSGVVRGFPALMKSFGWEALVIVMLVLFGIAVWAIRNQRRLAALVLMSGILVVVGYSTYTALFIRSTLDPKIDENNPDTGERLVSYLNREQYGDWSIAQRSAPLWEYQIKKMYIRYFGWQFIGKGTTLDEQGRITETLTLRGLLGLPFLLGVIGMFYHFYKDWRRAWPIFALFILTGLAIIVYLNQPDPQPRERDYSYTGSFFVFALWIGIGLTAIMDLIQQVLARAGAKQANGRIAVDRAGGIVPAPAGAQAANNIFATAVAGLVLAAVPVRMAIFNYESHDRTGNYVAYDYSYNILQSCAPNAILFTNGDNDTFPLWFLQYVNNIRTDVRVVNLSLLNTNWYIKQLRDDEPKVAIRMSDEEIENVQPRLFQAANFNIPVPPAIYDVAYQEMAKLDSALKREASPALRFELKPTLNTPYGSALRVQDLMILKILQDNQFRRPVYFAVTVSPDNKINLDPYMRMDGLAFRVMPGVKVDRRLVEPDLMWTNVNEKFLYRNLDNPEVYNDDNITSLLQNYRSAFLHLTQFHLSRRENDLALRALDRMSQVMPETVIPTNDFRISEAIGLMYSQAGRPQELDKRYRQIVTREFTNLDEQQKLQFADYFDYRGQSVLAESLVQDLIEQKPDFGEGYLWLGKYYDKQRRYDAGVEVVNRWLAKRPEDRNAQTLLAQLRTFARADSLRAAPVNTASDSVQK
ncbi:MAG: protein O-mannosyl-transferase family [bacterium]